MSDREDRRCDGCRETIAILVHFEEREMGEWLKLPEGTWFALVDSDDGGTNVVLVCSDACFRDVMSKGGVEVAKLRKGA